MKNNFFMKFIIIFILIFYFAMLYVNKFNFNYNIAICILWIFIFFISLIKYKMVKDRHPLKHSSIRIILIFLFSYTIIIYSLGLILGFNRGIFKFNIINIIRNITIPLIIIITQEFTRYILIKKTKHFKHDRIFIVLFFILINIVSNFSIDYFSNSELLFKFICLNVFSAIAFESLYSYLSYNISFVPVLILRIYFELYYFFIPLIPNLGSYLRSVFGILFPFLIYLTINKMVKHYNKEKEIINSCNKNYVTIPLVFMLLVVISLISGIFGYKMIAIGSGSMDPVFKMGDAIIYKKNFKSKDLKEGMIITFEKNSVLISHRIYDIKDTNGNILIKTKGDNNKTLDNFFITEKEIRGIVIYKIPYIGRPTIWLNNYLKK